MEHFNTSKEGGYSPFAGMPPEVVSHIFTFLNYTTLQSARLVCKNWYLASLDPQLIHREYLVLHYDKFNVKDGDQVKNELEKLQIVMKSSRRFFHLKIKDLKNFFWIPPEFWKTIGVHLQSMTIEKSLVPQDKIISDLMYCQNLKFLTLEKCEDFFSFEDIPGNLSLEVIKIICEKKLEFKFNKFLTCSPHLKSVDLDIRVLRRNSMTTRSTLAYVLQYFQHHTEVILRLSLCVEVGYIPSEEVVNDSFQEDVVKLLLLPNIQLRKFHTDMFPRSIYEIHQPWLRDLTLESYIETTTTDDMLESICSYCPNLQKLQMYGCEIRITCPSNFRLPRTLTHMILDLVEAGVTEAQLLAGLCSETNTTLKEAQMWCDDDISATFIKQFAKTHPSLTSLHLRCNIDDEALQAIFEHQTSLQELFIQSAGLSDAGLLGGRVENRTQLQYSISRLKDLTKLSLELSPIDGSAFEKIGTLPKIKTVLLGSTGVTQKALECLVENNPTIEELGVDSLKITDHFIYFAVKNLPHLKMIDCYDCPISEKAVDFLRLRKIQGYHTVQSLKVP